MLSEVHVANAIVSSVLPIYITVMHTAELCIIQSNVTGELQPMTSRIHEIPEYKNNIASLNKMPLWFAENINTNKTMIRLIVLTVHDCFL